MHLYNIYTYPGKKNTFHTFQRAEPNRSLSDINKDIAAITKNNTLSEEQQAKYDGLKDEQAAEEARIRKLNDDKSQIH